MLMQFRTLGQAVNVLPVAFSLAALLHQICGPSNTGQRTRKPCKYGLFFCVLLFATSLTSRVEILKKSWEHEAMHFDKRRTPQLISVLDAACCCLLHDLFALVLPEQVLEFLGDA